MMKRLTLTLLLLTSFLTAELELPKYPDLNKFPNAAQWGLHPFNNAPELGIVFNQLKTQYQLEVAVETGTYYAHTTAFFASLFDEVHTIELNQELHENACNFLSPFPHVTCHLGSSESVLKDLLPSLKGKRALFYLDAHWNEFWPLRDELKEIAKTHRNNCIVVIDDFKVPYRSDIGYDKYGPHECSLTYISDLINEIFPDGCSTHFLIPKDLASRAKFVAIPTHFDEEEEEDAAEILEIKDDKNQDR